MSSGSERPKTAFVLAGGGSFGAVQVGMLKALTAAGIVPDMVVGASVGAYNAAFYAANPERAGVDRLARIWLSIARRDVFPVTFGTLARFMWRGDVLVNPSGLRTLVERHLPHANIEQSRLPLYVVATDFYSGAAVVLSKGNAADAILASSAIPAAFAPVEIDGRYLVDGAITSNTPVRIAVELGARRLVVLPTGYACDLRAPPKGAIAAALHALTLLIARQLVAEIEALPADVSCAIVPTLCPLDGSPYDFTRTAELMDTAERVTTNWIADGGLERSTIPGSLRPHHHHAAAS